MPYWITYRGPYLHEIGGDAERTKEGVRSRTDDAGGLISSVTLDDPATSAWTATQRDDQGRLSRVTDPEGTVDYRYRDGRLVHASRDGTAAFRIAWTTDGRGNRRTRDVWTGVQAYRLDFASAGPRP